MSKHAEDDDISEMLSGPLSLEGLRQIQPLDEAFVAELRKQMQERARQWQHLAWALDAHLGAPLDVTSQDILETIKRLASDGNALWAKVERKVEP